MTTLRDAFTVSGIGLHSGAPTQVKVCPASEGEGRYFVRVDLPEKPHILAGVASVTQTTLSTELGLGAARVRTVEHLLGALVAAGVEDARIEVDAPEIPLLDGSALPWYEKVAQVGITSPQEGAERILQEPVSVYEGDAFVAAFPSPALRFTYGIVFPYAPIGEQWSSWQPTRESFAEAIAPARTFGFADQIEQLRQAGLIKGGSLENALVCDRQRWLNPPLRFPNEPARHKLLDLLGDLSLLGSIPRAHYLAFKASHHLHVQLARMILAGF
jgi:UDP-3-O-[3-hydroxymyristoyl] N-acetylglucosamine deacetylase